MTKYTQRGFLIIIIMLAIIIFVENIPLKKAIKLEDLKNNSTNNNLYEILICKVSQSTGPNWVVIGNESGLFSHEKKQESIIIEGNIPQNKLTQKLFIHSSNLFVMKGKIDGEKKQFDYDTERFRVFYVEDWYLLTPIDRGVSLRLFARKGHLSLFDYIF